MGRGRIRAPKQGKHRKGRMPKGTKPNPAGWKMKERARLQHEQAANRLAGAAYQLSLNLGDKFDGDLDALVDRIATRQPTPLVPTLVTRAKQIVQEEMRKAREASQRELEEAKHGDE